MNQTIKNKLRSLPLLPAMLKKIRQKREHRVTMQLNRTYRRAITPLFDPTVLEARIAAVETACKNPESAVFYVISQSNEKVGIFGYVNCFLPHIAYAVAKGFIPVIDMETYRYIYSPEDGRRNVWEMFFEQPCGFGLEELNGKQIKRCPDTLWYRWMPNTCPLMSDAELALWSSLYDRFVRPNARSREYLREELREVLTAPEQTVGVIYRGTTYTKGQATGHPIQPTMKMLADQVRRTMETEGCAWVYLASDERSIVDYFNAEFPGRVLINKRVYYDEVDGVDYSNYNKDGTDLTGSMFDRPDNRYLIGIEYISSMNLVANCAALVAGACGGSTAALYMNGMRYRSRYIFELGKYGTDPVPEDE